MGELAKYQPNEIYVNEKHKVVIPDELPVVKKHRDIYLSNKNFPPLKMIEDKNIVVNEIHAYVNKTIMDKGVNITPEEIQYIKQSVTQDIMTHYTHLTLEEIRLAFYYGVRGELGEYYGINATTFDGWLKKYRTELMPKSNKVVQKYLPKPKQQARPQREVDEAIANTLCDVYFNLVKNGQYDFYDIGNFGYKFLDELGLIPFTVEEKQAMMKESRIAFKNNIIDRNRGLTRDKSNSPKINLKRAFEQLEKQNNPTFEYQIKIGAMRIAIFKFMWQLGEEEVDLKELIDSKLQEKKYEDE